VLVIGGEDVKHCSLKDCSKHTSVSASRLPIGSHTWCLWCLFQLQGIAQEVSKRQGGKQHPVVFTAAADASKYEDMERVIGEAIQACGPIHALVCCQGICRPFVFDDWSLQGMREVILQASFLQSAP